MARAQSTAPPHSAGGEAVAKWLETSAIPIASVTAGSGFTDLAPLRETLAGVRIVGLGEATHGTREFFQFKHRMVEFLVEELGFTVFVMEGGYAGLDAVNDWVLGAGDAHPTDVLARNAAVIWNTEEVRDLLLWIRAHNAKVDDDAKVWFVGCEAQVTKPAAQFVLSYLERVAPQRVPTAKEAFAHLYPVTHEWAYRIYPKKPVAERERARERLFALLGFVANDRARFTRLSSAAEYEKALFYCRLLLQADEMRNFDGDARDRYMAANVEHVIEVERPGARAIVWAHDFHVSRVTTGFRPDGRRTDLRPMGSHLAERYGDAYYAIGFVFDHGAFQAGDEDVEESGAPFAGLVEFTLGPAPGGSLGGVLSTRRLGRYLVDLRALPAGPVAAWFGSSQAIRIVGAGFSKRWPEAEYAVPIVPRDHFDALFFVEETTRARPLPFDPTVRPYEG